MKRVDDFRQRQPEDGLPASQKTTAYLGYTDKSLYVVFVCYAPPGQVRAHLSKRDDLGNDDTVTVVLDTYNGRQRGYEFLVNPLGIQADGVEAEGLEDDMSFDAVWNSDGRITAEGYAVLINIPFRSVRFSSGKLQTWGIALARSIPTNNEISYWPYVSREIASFNQQLGTARGMESISPGRNIQFIPYGAFGSSHLLQTPDTGVPSYRSKVDFRGGLDAKAVLRDSLTLDVTANPDFSQVESDDPQVTINQRYEVVFPEKRPFFLENSGFFATPETLFFSRRIADPEFGARMTGKVGRWNLGVLGSDDRSAGDALDQTDPHYGGRAAIGVLRAQREFDNQSSVGVFISDRTFAGSYNRVGAADFRWKLGENWSITGQAITSQTRTRDGLRTGGDAFNFSAHRQSRRYSFDLAYTDRAAGFQADLGYIQRTNIRQLEQSFARTFFPHSKVVKSMSARVQVMGDMDHAGVQQDWSVDPTYSVEMGRNTNSGVFYARKFERYGGINFRTTDVGSFFHTEYFKVVTFDGSYSTGTRINYSPPQGVNPFLGDGSEMQAQMTFRPSSRLKVDNTYYLTRLRTRADSFENVPRTQGGRPASVFTNHLARTKLSYQFTRELSLRMIVDYSGLLQNPALIDTERQKRITADALLTYLLHPGTALYIGYTDQRENQTLVPGQPPYLARTGWPSVTTGRQLFIKLSYLIRL